MELTDVVDRAGMSRVRIKKWVAQAGQDTPARVRRSNLEKFFLRAVAVLCAASSAAAHADPGLAMGIPPGLGVALWLPLLVLTLGCAAWLLALILLQRKANARYRRRSIAAAVRTIRRPVRI
jgi:hypothetical protein